MKLKDLTQARDNIEHMLNFIVSNGMLHKFKSNNKQSHFCSLEESLLKISEEIARRQEIIKDI